MGGASGGMACGCGEVEGRREKRKKKKNRCSLWET